MHTVHRVSQCHRSRQLSSRIYTNFSSVLGLWVRPSLPVSSHPPSRSADHVSVSIRFAGPRPRPEAGRAVQLGLGVPVPSAVLRDQDTPRRPAQGPPFKPSRRAGEAGALRVPRAQLGWLRPRGPPLAAETRVRFPGDSHRRWARPFEPAPGGERPGLPPRPVPASPCVVSRTPRSSVPRCSASHGPSCPEHVPSAVEFPAGLPLFRGHYCRKEAAWLPLPQ